jgi:hypothetical protein
MFIKNADQIMLVLILLVPGYISYSIKEMWSTYRTKNQFEKMINSLVCSLLIWLFGYFFVTKLIGSYLAEYHNILLIVQISSTIISIFLLAYILTSLEREGFVFWLGKKLNISVKMSHNISVLEDIIGKSKHIGEIKIVTTDGSIYKAKNRKNGGKIIWGSLPHPGDISFICHYYKDKDGQAIKYDEADLIKDKYYVRTFIPKHSIKTIKFVTDFLPNKQ